MNKQLLEWTLNSLGSISSMVITHLKDIDDETSNALNQKIESIELGLYTYLRHNGIIGDDNNEND